MIYRLAIKLSAKRELVRLPDKILRQVDEAILSLAENPRQSGAKKLTGLPLYRIKVRSYRVVYEINDRNREVTVTTIGHRREVYRA